MDGLKLRALREQLDITTRRLAKEMGISESYLCKLECGRRRLAAPTYQRAEQAMRAIQGQRNRLLPPA